MASTHSTLEQMQSAQKQMTDNFMENYQQMVESMMPGDTPVKAASEMSLAYFTRMREIMEPMMVTVPGNPQELMDHTMSFMKKASDLNVEFSSKYLSMFQDMMKNWDMTAIMGMGQANPTPEAPRSAKKAKKDAE